MLVLDPVFAPDTANRIAMTVVPLMTLLASMASATESTRRLSDVEREKLAVLLGPISIPIIYQMRALRIDYRGWQIVLAMVGTRSSSGDRRCATAHSPGWCWRRW